MNYQFEILRKTRENFKKVADSLTIEQINIIPEGFRNNIVWNVGHSLATQQLLIYKLSSNEMKLSQEFIAKYRKGTAPTGVISENQWYEIVSWLDSTLIQMEKDYVDGIFKTYTSYTASYGATFSTIEEAIQYNNAHEALHLGYAMALRKSLIK